jgi:hypothetical protein
MPPDERPAAIERLASIGPRALDALFEGLGAQSWLAREGAALALARIAATGAAAWIEPALPSLVRNLRDPVRAPRVAANSALEAIAGQSFGFDEGIDDEFTEAQIEAIAAWERWLAKRRSEEQDHAR